MRRTRFRTRLIICVSAATDGGKRMYILKYLVDTANGSKSEKTLKVDSYPEYKAAMGQFKKFGYTVVLNTMCKDCVHYGEDCHGEVNHVYTGCVSKKVA